MAQEFIHQLNIVGPDKTMTITLSPGENSIGRQAGVDILLEHPMVSRKHAQIECTDVGCVLIDLGSSNGTAVNDEKLTPNVPIPLPEGAVIQMGPFTLTLRREKVQVETPPALPPKQEAPPPKPELQPEPQAKPKPKVVKAPAAKPKPQVAKKSKPPAPPPPPPVPPAPPDLPDSPFPPGLTQHSSRLLPYLPGIYHTDFMSRFLGLFESILTPIEWNIDNFDLFLNPKTAPHNFLPWLAQWYEISFNDSWSEDQRRRLLAEAHKIYGRRGTKWALARVLNIYTGHEPDIDDQNQELDPFTFTVRIPLRRQELNQELIERIIDMNKPAHTSYKLKFKR